LLTIGVTGHLADRACWMGRLIWHARAADGARASLVDPGLRPLVSGIFGVSQFARQTWPVFQAKNRVAKQRFWRSAVPYRHTAFQHLLKPLDRRVVKRFVDTHDGDRGVGEGDNSWTCWRHMKTLLFAQFAGLQSLREIEQALAARPAALYHLGLRPPRRSTLSDASAKRPYGVFRDLCEHLMGSMARKARAEGRALIQLLDASPIPLRDARFDWAEADSRVRGLKLHMLYDPDEDQPVHFDVTSPKVSDIANGRTLALRKDVTYVYDKGYTDFSWWQDIHQAGAFFVTRLKKNAHRRDIKPRPAEGDGILADHSLKIGHKKPRGGATNRLWDTELREIVVEREGKQPLYLITNDHTRTAAEIAALYKLRWQIELFFKWLKQHLKIKTFLGRSENAVKMQIYAALIAFILLRLFKDTYARGHTAGQKALLARLKVSLFERLDLTKNAKPPPKPPQSRPLSPQLNLGFTCQNALT